MTSPPDGTVALVDGAVVLRYERYYAHPVERVWSALTEPDELPSWWGAAVVDLEPGGDYIVQWLNADEQGNVTLMHAVVTELRPPAVLELQSDVHGRLRWELRTEDGGCLLTLVNDTPAPDEFVLRVLAGWHAQLDYLDDHLAGTSVDWPAWTSATRSRSSGLSWDDHYDRYSRRLAR